MFLAVAATAAQLVDDSKVLPLKPKKVSTDDLLNRICSAIESLLAARHDSSEAREYGQELRELQKRLDNANSRKRKEEAYKYLLDLADRLDNRIRQARIYDLRGAVEHFVEGEESQMLQSSTDGSSVILRGSKLELGEEDIPVVRESTLRAHHVIAGQTKISSLVSDSKSDSSHTDSDSSSASPVYVQLGPLPDTSLMVCRSHEIEMKIADLLGRMPCGYAGAKDVRVHTWNKMPQYVWIEFPNSLDACSFDVSWHSQQPEGFEGVESYHTPQ